MTKPTRLTKTDIEGMVHLAKTDPGMEDLLAKALEYYILKGKPAGPEEPGDYRNIRFNM